MDRDTRRNLLSILDMAVRHVAQSRANVAAQQERVAGGRQRGDDTAQSESLLANFRESLRLHEARHDDILIDLQR